MDVLDNGSFAKTLLLQAKDYNVSPDQTGGVSPLVSAPSWGRATVRGRVFGFPGAYAMLATSIAAFQNPPPLGGYAADAELVGVGDCFHFELNYSQTLYGLASVSPQVSWGNPGTLVWIAFSVAFVEVEAKIFTQPVEGGPPAGITGPGLGWRKG